MCEQGWGGEGRGEGMDWVTSTETLGDGSGELGARERGRAGGPRLCSEEVGWGVE